MNMMLVQFACAGCKCDPELDRDTYVRAVFAELMDKGLIDSIVLDQEGDGFNTDPIQEYFGDAFSFKFVHSDRRRGSGLLTEIETSYVFEVQFVFGTYDSGLQLSVYIFSDSYIPTPQREYLEALKFSIKETIKGDWERIEWLFDKDSECLAVDLYPQIFVTENLIRQMISESMMKSFGFDWWDKFTPFTVQNKHRARLRGYKSVVQGFANIDERLLSVDIGDLLSIITFKLGKWIPQYDVGISKMVTGEQEWNPEKIKMCLERQINVEIDLWDRIFSKYLPTTFPETARVFETNRNHVAHNKLLDRQAYTVIKSSIMETQDAVKEAIKKMNTELISEEEKEHLLEEQAELDDALEEIEESEAGVEIRHEDEIEELFDSIKEQIATNLSDAFRFRNDIEIRNEDCIVIRYKINNIERRVSVECSINDEEGASSTLELRTDDGFRDTLEYINGQVGYNEEQGCYFPLTKDSIPDVEDTVKRLIDYIDNAFPNLRAKVDSEAYKVLKDGEQSPVLIEFACDECGQFYIASDNRFAEIGTCLNCGTKHRVKVCIKCGTCFVDDGNTELCLCENCQVEDED